METYKTLLPVVNNNSQSVIDHDERRAYKNISIYVAELPATPTRFGDKYHRGYTAKASDAAPVSQGDRPQSQRDSRSTASSKLESSSPVVKATTSLNEARDCVSHESAGEPEIVPLPDIMEPTSANQRPEEFVPGLDISFLGLPPTNSPFKNRMFSAHARYVLRWAGLSRRFYSMAPSYQYGYEYSSSGYHYNNKFRSRVMPYPVDFAESKDLRYTGLKDPEVWANAFIF